jgi:uncharacterized protein with HEPN domain
LSDQSDRARLETIAKLIGDIERIVQRHGSVRQTLDDFEGQHAVLMCIAQIGELLGKIRAPEYVQALPVKQAAGMRNLIMHNYENVDSRIAEITLTASIPELKRLIAPLLSA